MSNTALTSLFDLTGRTAIVTGGTRGIGLAIAKGLAAAGANVAVASRKADACDRTQTLLRSSFSANAIGVPTHMGDLAAIDALVERTVDEFGGVDIVINNAANALAQPIGDNPGRLVEVVRSQSTGPRVPGPGRPAASSGQ